MWREEKLATLRNNAIVQGGVSLTSCFSKLISNLGQNCILVNLLILWKGGHTVGFEALVHEICNQSSEDLAIQTI